MRLILRMNEFDLIKAYFSNVNSSNNNVIFGIGDDAACLRVPEGMDLLVSSDTLVGDVHFKASWDAFDIAQRAIRVNVSDMAAMAATPAWITLAITLPTLNESWLDSFSKGISCALSRYNLSLVGGDTTKGPLSITVTIHGLVPNGRSVRRSGASPGDRIYVSGDIGAAAQAVLFLDNNPCDIPPNDSEILFDKLLLPKPRIDLINALRESASSAIDISDGLAADLNHILKASGVGACIDLVNIPIHPLVHKYQQENAFDFALSGGDDYELCFTIPRQNEKRMLENMVKDKKTVYCIGYIEEQYGLRIRDGFGKVDEVTPRGYSHF